MPKKISNSIRAGIVKAHYRKRENGRFEIRCTINKIAISGSGRTLERAKENFIKNLNSADFEHGQLQTQKYTFFCEFAEQWFETVKKPTVKFTTYKSLFSTYNSQIKKYFEGKRLRSITPLQIQPLFNELDAQGRNRTSQLVKLLLSQIFQAAADERLIPSNPMNSVRVLKRETKKGEALSYEEERNFLQCIQSCRYKLSFFILLYAGMRRSELPTMRIKNNFILVQNAKKRITQQTTFRRIPITPMLKPYLENASPEEIEFAINVDSDVLTHNFKRFCPDHHLHELRHTYISHCLECGVPREVVSVWAGHAADRTMTSTVYTHFSDEFMLEQGQKVDYTQRLENLSYKP